MLVVCALGTGVVLAVLMTSVAYREWGPTAPCMDVIEMDARASACAGATAPGWLLLINALVLGSASAWITVRAIRDHVGANGRGG